MDFSFYLIVAVTFFGFIGLAFVLLYPVYRFLSRETELSEEWTPEALAERRRRAIARGTEGGDGAPTPPPVPRPPSPGDA